MKRMILSLLYRLKVDIIVDQWIALIDDLRLMRVRECTGQQLKYVNQGWNGCTMPGMMCPVGVYYYVLTYSCMSLPDKPIMKHGSVTLVR